MIAKERALARQAVDMRCPGFAPIGPQIHQCDIVEQDDHNVGT